MDKLRSALLYGADAVYLGGRALNLRASAQGFTPDELAQAVTLAERAGARVYYCLNSYLRQSDLAAVPGEVERAAQAGVHALIVADAGALPLARTYAPGMELHLSTQANLSNSAAAAFWYDQGAARVNVARELSYPDILALRRESPAQLELECFVHGALCLALSGQCLMSAWLNDRSANQGRCTQPCRFEYRTYAPGTCGDSSSGTSDFLPAHAGNVLPDGDGPEPVVLEERKREGQPLWYLDAEDYHAVWSPDDICLLPYVGWFTRHGVNALKIEGRMKSAAHVALVVDVYASALQGFRRGIPLPTRVLMDELLSTAVRPLSSGFFLPGRRKIFGTAAEAAAKPVLARVMEQVGKTAWLVEAKDNWPADASVEVLLPGLRRPRVASGDYMLENHRGERNTLLPCGTRGIVRVDEVPLEAGVFIRRSAV